MLRVSDRFLARYMRDTDLAGTAVYLAWERCYRDWLDRRYVLAYATIMRADARASFEKFDSDVSQTGSR